MPLFIDIHKHVHGLTKYMVTGASELDLDALEQHDLSYLRYWFSTATGDVFCLVEAPDKEAVIDLHCAVHGIMPDEIIEVQEGVIGNHREDVYEIDNGRSAGMGRAQNTPVNSP